MTVVNTQNKRQFQQQINKIFQLKEINKYMTAVTQNKRQFQTKINKSVQPKQITDKILKKTIIC